MVPAQHGSPASPQWMHVERPPLWPQTVLVSEHFPSEVGVSEFVIGQHGWPSSPQPQTPAAQVP